MVRRMAWYSLVLSCMVSFFAQNTSAGLAFNGYVQHIDQIWNDSFYVYDTSYQPSQIGDVQLEKSSITINPCGSYLDVTEDAWVTGSLWSWTDPALLGAAFSLEGALQLPAKSALVGAMVWVGDRAYKCHLSPTMTAGQYPYDDSGTVTAKATDSLLKITQTAESSYRLSLFKVKFGESKHVRLRYLMANSGGGTAAYQLPVVFASGDASLDRPTLH